MKIDVFSIFPKYLQALELSLVGKAIQDELVQLQVHDLRDWTIDRHKTVDDTPYGGGAGMVMKADVWGRALDEVVNSASTLIIPTPTGYQFNQELAENLSQRPHLVFACGRYEGIDSRIAQHYAKVGIEVIPVSIGDYVLNGGEVATLAIIEASVRLIPGMMGNPQSLVEESFCGDGLLEYPIYTRPTKWRETEVPEVLLSGHHKKISEWRHLEPIKNTVKYRPDLILKLDPSQVTKAEKQTLHEFGFTIVAGKFTRAEPSS